jgi:hypothetical protein
MTGNKHFAKAEELMHSNYDMRQTQTVTNGSQIKFGEVQIGRDPDGTLGISQEAYIKNLSNIKADLHNDKKNYALPRMTHSVDIMGRMFCCNFLRISRL